MNLFESIVRIGFGTLMGAMLLIALGIRDHEQAEKPLAQVAVTTPSGNSGGSGSHIQLPSGKIAILTNMHVCEVADKNDYVTIWHSKYFKQKKIQGHKRKVIARYPKHDLCLVEPLTNAWTALKVAKEKLKFADKLLLTGHPLLLPFTLSHGQYMGKNEIFLNYGFVKADRCIGQVLAMDLDRVQTITDLFNLGERLCFANLPSDYITTPAAGGNSGSPILNASGEIVSVLYAGDNELDHAAFGVPLEFIQDFISDK